MSLDYNFQKIDKYKTVCLGVPWEEASPEEQSFGWYNIPPNGDSYVVKPVTHNIIWACLVTGIGEIKETDIPEFWARYVTWNALKGFTNGFTLDDLRQHIGLGTNVFPKETRPAWRKRVIDAHLDDIKRGARLEVKKVS